MNKLSKALAAGALSVVMTGCAGIKSFVGEKTGANTSAETELQGNTQVEFGTLVNGMKGQLSATRQGVLIIRGDMNDTATNTDVLDASAMAAYKGAVVALVGKDAANAENAVATALGADNVVVIPSEWDATAAQDKETRVKITQNAGTEIMKVASANEGRLIIAIVPKDMGDLRQDGLPETLVARNLSVKVIDVSSKADYEAEMAAGSGMFTAYTATHEPTLVNYDPETGIANYTQGAPESDKKAIDTAKDPVVADQAPAPGNN
ncbi:MAG: hypothetical protein GC137_06240 [Alphaproteobacteria bacterium]|nr:hypothetical protein [Alphaproteobacteria bacterium]